MTYPTSRRRVHSRGERALPDVAAVFSFGCQFVTPGVAGLVEASACGLLPLGLGGKATPDPLGIGLGLEPVDVHHGMVVEAVEIGVRTGRMAPVGTLDRSPPLSSGNTTGRWEIIGQEAGEDERPSVGFGQGDETGAFDECCEFGVGDRCPTDGERRHVDAANRTLPISREAVVVGSHPERSRRDLDRIGSGRGRTNRPWGTDGSSWGNWLRWASSRASSLAHPDSCQEACAIAERARSSATRLRPISAWSEEAGVGTFRLRLATPEAQFRLVRA